MNKTLSIIVGLAILLIAGYLFVARKSPQPATQADTNSTSESVPSSTNEEAASNEVTYTDSGFSPSTLTVKAGETVTFRNMSSGAFWPASNNHPTHTLYPEFDAKKNIAAGDSYSFTFEKKGTWGYHNHLNPSDTGTIVVE